MKPKISILGCGWLGLALAEDLLQKGYQVSGSSRLQRKQEMIRAKGIEPFVLDVGNKDYCSLFLDSDILIIAITSKEISHFKNLIYQIEKSNTQKVIFISSTSVYPNTNGVVTENSSVKNTELTQIEQLFSKNKRFQTTVLRFGGLFGYDRQPGNFIKEGKKIANPEGYVNLIHRDDCIQIISQIISKNIWNEIFNACADSHPKRKEFYKKQMQKLGREAKFDENSKNEYKMVSSKKLIHMLNYQFIYRDLINY